VAKIGRNSDSAFQIVTSPLKGHSPWRLSTISSCSIWFLKLGSRKRSPRCRTSCWSSRQQDSFSLLLQSWFLQSWTRASKETSKSPRWALMLGACCDIPQPVVMGGIRLGGGWGASINFFSIKHSVSGDRCRVARHIFKELVIEATYHTHTHTHDVDTIHSSITNRRSDQTHKYIYI